MPKSTSSIFYKINNIKLHTIQSGLHNNKVIIMLHGFPEFWYAYRYQIDLLVRHGFHVIIPDQRGYNLSDKPAGVENYTLDLLTSDILEIINTIKHKVVYMVGHDFGGYIVWNIAKNHPNLVKRIVILNSPPIQVYQACRYNPMQIIKSWYIYIFKIPVIAEFLFKFNNFIIPKLMLRLSAKNIWSDQVLEKYLKSWSADSVHSMINWYRAVFIKYDHSDQFDTVIVPTLILWGEKDLFFTKKLALLSYQSCQYAHLIFFKKNGHFIQHEIPDKISSFILHWFTACEDEIKGEFNKIDSN